METNESYVRSLIFMTRTYEGITKQITAAKLRTLSLMPEKNLNHDTIIKEMESVKGKIERRIGKELELYPIWNEWLVNVPGIGNTTAAKLILHYYFKLIPICQDCETELEKTEGTFYCPTCQKSVKGEGNLVHKVFVKDFPRISSWWHYMGRHNSEHCPECRKRLVNGVCETKKCKNFEQEVSDPIYLMPKRQSGVQSDWSTPGRTTGHMIKESFNRMKGDHPYRAYADRQKEIYAERHPDWTKGHVHNVAWNNTVKLFLSHFWQVARTLDGLELTDPYIIHKNPAHNLIKPYFFDWDKYQAAA